MGFRRPALLAGLSQLRCLTLNNWGIGKVEGYRRAASTGQVRSGPWHHMVIECPELRTFTITSDGAEDLH
ncbi:hypothetical protein WJX72_008169 [[Myrmecia] bisecta]|uniref:Uncharacterized protein n=1 Tax=[Myrmecia] bisecta TaxID=41462 RepID=A0AAW1P531_9CHLO